MADFGYLMVALTKRLKTALNRALSDSDLTISQWAVLAAVQRAHQDVTAAEISLQLAMDKPTVSGVVRRLVAKNLVTLTPKPDDRRAQTLALTTTGQAAFRHCAGLAEQTVDAFLTPLAESDREVLVTLLTTLEEVTRDENFSAR
ncbi:MarR family winged helix-turn-helix transcriptional regulator [Lacticaseibacillus sp. GG6-2]